MRDQDPLLRFITNALTLVIYGSVALVAVATTLVLLAGLVFFTMATS